MQPTSSHLPQSVPKDAKACVLHNFLMHYTSTAGDRYTGGSSESVLWGDVHHFSNSGTCDDGLRDAAAARDTVSHTWESEGS